MKYSWALPAASPPSPSPLGLGARPVERGDVGEQVEQASSHASSAGSSAGRVPASVALPAVSAATPVGSRS